MMHIQSKVDFLTEDCIVKISEERISIQRLTLDHSGKTQKMTKVDTCKNSYKMGSCKPMARAYAFNEDESSEDKLVFDAKPNYHA